MALAPPITDIQQLTSHPALGRLIGWNASVVQEVKFDREELTIWIAKEAIREVCTILRDSADCPFNYLADLTCVDWYPAEPRFEVVYHLLSISKKERVRLKVRLDGSSPAIESVTSVWPAADFYDPDAGRLGRPSYAEGLSGGRLPIGHDAISHHCRRYGWRARSRQHHDLKHGATTSLHARGAAADFGN